MPAFVIVLLLAIGSTLFHHSEQEEKSNYSSSESGYYFQNRNHRTIDRDQALDEYWDDIKEYINGTETIEVYSHESGNYYDLDADISNGEVEVIHFEHGGYIYINAELNSDGSGEGYGSDSYWDVQIDSSLIDDAVDEWASDNGYTLND
jgi:hypothetical protein